MRRLLKNVIPSRWKLQLKLMQRYFREQRTGFQYPEEYLKEDIGPYKNEFRQDIKKGEYIENKIHNLKIVSGKINNLVIKPGEVLSFWKLIGKPTLENNFKEGRNLIGNSISSGTGGGICQFSSILYYAALQAGFRIIERYPHSVDIYKEGERFTPLGSDCTVVYGYKDLQIQNCFPFPVQFRSFVSNQELHLILISPENILLNDIRFQYSETGKGVWVETFAGSRLLFKNFYIRL